jgi:regulatory protein YycI of two-component signal transduction system YycFG
MDDNFKLVRSFQYSSEAQIFKGKLESEGIEVYIRDNHIVDSKPIWSNAVGGVKLFVKREDFEKATITLSEISQYSIDENNKLIKCPSCGAEEIEMVTSIKDKKTFFAFIFSSLFALLLFVFMPLYSKYRYKCNNCKFEFN